MFRTIFALKDKITNQISTLFFLYDSYRIYAKYTLLYQFLNSHETQISVTLL